MSERIIIRQDREFETTILAPDPRQPDSDDLVEAVHIYQLSPYGMMLSGLGSCTCIVLHTFSQHHGIDLESVEIRLRYDRDYKKDCTDCEATEKYDEVIQKEFVFSGNLSDQDREKLLRVARYCPIYKILKNGIHIESRLDES